MMVTGWERIRFAPFGISEFISYDKSVLFEIPPCTTWLPTIASKAARKSTAS
jgi:hypothetical protein